MFILVANVELMASQSVWLGYAVVGIYKLLELAGHSFVENPSA